MRKSRAEVLAIGLMVLGIVMVCQPVLHALFRWGFLVTLLGIAAFTVANHLKDDHA